MHYGFSKGLEAPLLVAIFGPALNRWRGEVEYNNRMIWGRKLFKELNRRGVLRAVAAYIALIWLLAQGVVDLFPAIGLPEWTIKAFLVCSVAGTPVIGFLAWRYDLTTSGLLRDKHDLAVALREKRRITPDATRSTEWDCGRTSNSVVVCWEKPDGTRCERTFRSAFLIGRDDHADVQISDDRVSRRHIRVYASEDNWWVKDLNSLNGTYSHGQPIDSFPLEGEVELSLHRHGPRIQLRIDRTDVTQSNLDR